MSRLLDIAHKLSDTRAAVRELERYLSADPDNEALQINLHSVLSRSAVLEDEFIRIAGAEQLNICSYRIHSLDSRSLPIESLGNALAHFQKWFTIVYDALAVGPKSRARLSPDIVEKTTLDFGFAYTGSVGVALTVPRDRLLFDLQLRDAVSLTTEMLNAQSSDQVHHYARIAGAAGIKALHSLVEDHVNSNTGVEIKWYENDVELASVDISPERMRYLQQAIGETSDTEETEIRVQGLLVGADTATHTFHMVFDEASEIRGRMSDSIGSDYIVELPKPYIAIIQKTAFINYATEQETTRYYLLRLEKTS